MEKNQELIPDSVNVISEKIAICKINSNEKNSKLGGGNCNKNRKHCISTTKTLKEGINQLLNKLNNTVGDILNMY